MCEEGTDKEINIASGIKVASDNKISLFNIEMDFSGLKDAIALFFPDFRHEMILRYRAETSAKILLEANRLAHNENIQINPIPPKIAYPIFEKMSLEHEEDMYEKWAKLLITAGVKPEPIQQQYAEVLANLNYQSTNLLKKIYTSQTDPYIEDEFEDYIGGIRLQKEYRQINNEIKLMNYAIHWDKELLPEAGGRLFGFPFPYLMPDTKERGNNNKKPINEERNMLMGLERLGLIKYLCFTDDEFSEEKQTIIYTDKTGILLAKYGYFFVECLENPTKE